MQNTNMTEESRTLQNIKNWFLYIKLGEEILAFRDIGRKKIKFNAIKVLFSIRCRYWESVSIKHDFFWWKKTKNILLVTGIMMMKFNHHI